MTHGFHNLHVKEYKSLEARWINKAETYVITHYHVSHLATGQNTSLLVMSKREVQPT